MSLLSAAVALAEKAASWPGAYVHIPFCARLCPYCDFAVVPGRLDVADRYMAAVVAEVEMEPEWYPLDTVFFGGGTPSSVPVESLLAVLGALGRRFGFGHGAEITIEANPEDIDDRYAGELAAAGVTRVSLGAQSFNPVVLDSLGRRHRPADIDRAVASLQAAGIRSTSLDLIFGDPSESRGSWIETLNRALGSNPDHVSTYALTVEPGTALGRSVRAGAPAPDEDVQADRWEVADRTLAAAGYRRYEFSNASRPGHESRHNLATWAQGEYLAFGLGAHGHRAGVRRRNVRRLEAYLEAVESGRRPEAGREQADAWSVELERVMLGLRRTVGVEAGEAGRALLATVEGRRLRDAGVVGVDEGRLVMRRPLLTDAVIRALLGLAARS